MSSSKITEIVDEPKPTQITERELLGQPCVTATMFVRAPLPFSIPTAAAMEAYDEKDQKDWQPLYLLPLSIENDAGVFDKFGQTSLRGARVWSSYAALYESDMGKHFPTLVRHQKWRDLFQNIFDAMKELKPRTEGAKYPIMILQAGEHGQYLNTVMEICKRDTFAATYGPFSY